MIRLLTAIRAGAIIVTGNWELLHQRPGVCGSAVSASECLDGDHRCRETRAGLTYSLASRVTERGGIMKIHTTNLSARRAASAALLTLMFAAKDVAHRHPLKTSDPATTLRGEMPHAAAHEVRDIQLDRLL